jgi:hypothetical protein
MYAWAPSDVHRCKFRTSPGDRIHLGKRQAFLHFLRRRRVSRCMHGSSHFKATLSARRPRLLVEELVSSGSTTVPIEDWQAMRRPPDTFYATPGAIDFTSTKCVFGVKSLGSTGVVQDTQSAGPAPRHLPVMFEFTGEGLLPHGGIRGVVKTPAGEVLNRYHRVREGL